MHTARHEEIKAVRRVLPSRVDGPSDHAKEIHRLLRSGAGEEALVEYLTRHATLSPAARVEVTRALLKLGVRPAGSARREQRDQDVCTICDRPVPFCWGCRCGFRICQACLEANRWGITCNNITWECPDCGAMRSF